MYKNRGSRWLPADYTEQFLNELNLIPVAHFWAISHGERRPYLDEIAFSTCQVEMRVHSLSDAGFYFGVPEYRVQYRSPMNEKPLLSHQYLRVWVHALNITARFGKLLANYWRINALWDATVRKIIYVDSCLHTGAVIKQCVSVPWNRLFIVNDRLQFEFAEAFRKVNAAYYFGVSLEPEHG
jgi:hypothetical protein